MKKKLNKFFNPKSIAVVGASEKKGKVGFVLIEKLKEFPGKVIPVNIQGSFIFGNKVYKSVDKIPKRPDLVIIATPNFTVKKILEDCVKRKVRNAIIITAGFAEVGNFKLQKEILEISKKYKIKILGPNCFGVSNPHLKLDTTFSNNSAFAGTTAFISQSGALWSYLSDYRIGFSGFASLGNMADLEFTDFLKYFNKDKKTKKIILYVEKLKNGREFIDICKKSKKEIIVVKSGQSKEGSEVAMSHTASLATDYEIYRGAFKQAKVKVAESLAEAVGLKEENITEKIKAKEVAIITNAGGAGSLITDKLENSGIDVGKIVDLLGTAKAKDYARELNKKIYNGFKQIVVILTPQRMSEPKKVAGEIIKSKNRKR